MTDTLQTILPILLIDVLNPILLALLIFAAGTPRPVANSAAMLLGHTGAYFFAGYLLSFGVTAISERLANPQSIDYAISALLGLYCIYTALSPDKPSAQADEPDWQLTPLKCLYFGGVISAIGISFAIPYMGAIDQILKANLSLTESFALLGIYKLCYALPFAVVPMAILVMGEDSRPLLNRLNTAMTWAIEKLMPWLIFLLGIWLVVDAALYFRG